MKTISIKKTFFILCFIFLSSVFLSQVFSYKILYVVDKAPKKITKKINFKSQDLKNLIQQSLDITKEELSFNLSSKGNSDVNFLNKTKQAHCVGYSNYFNSILNNLLIYNNIKNVRIHHVRAKVNFLGMDLHFINMKEFKDHDICIIYDDRTNTKYIVDPSLSEIFGDIILN